MIYIQKFNDFLFYFFKTNYNLIFETLKDTRVWIPDPDKVWKAAKLLDNYNQNSPTLRLITEDDEIVIDSFKKILGLYSGINVLF